MRSSPESLIACVTRLAVVACLLALSPVLFARQKSPAAEDESAGSEPPSEEVIDEVTVVAPRTVASIRSDIIRVEEVMYDIFNSLNTDRDFRVSCGWENRNTGNPSTTSRIKEWRCQTAYERGIPGREFRDVAGAAPTVEGATLTSGTLSGPIRRHREAFKQKMLELAEQNPGLARAIYIRAALEQDLAAARARKSETELLPPGQLEPAEIRE